MSIVTRWSCSGGIEAYLSGQLASFSALALLVVIWPVKYVPEMTSVEWEVKLLLIHSVLYHHSVVFILLRIIPYLENWKVVKFTEGWRIWSFWNNLGIVGS